MTSGIGTSSCGEAEAVVRWDREQGGTQIEVIALMILGPCPRAARETWTRRHRRRRSSSRGRARSPIRRCSNRRSSRPRSSSRSRGELEEAAALVAEYERERPGRLDSLPIAVLVCVAAERADLADPLVEGAADAVPLPASRHALTSAKAIVAESRGRRDEAASLYAASRSGLAGVGLGRRAGLRPARPRALRRRGRVAGGAGDLRAPRRRPVHGDRRLRRHGYGLMLWLWWKTLSGSYFRLTSTSRS